MHSFKTVVQINDVRSRWCKMKEVLHDSSASYNTKVVTLIFDFRWFFTIYNYSTSLFGQYLKSIQTVMSLRALILILGIGLASSHDIYPEGI